MTDRQLIVWLALAGVIAVGGVILLSVTLVWLLDLFSEDPREQWPSRRAVFEPEPVTPYWVRELPPPRTCWDVPSMRRVEIQLASIYRAVDMATVPQLRPAWVAETKRRLEIEAGL